MPAKGGASGKSGDQYELLWAVDAALRIVNGRAEQVTYESLDPEESRGVEFNLTTTLGEVEFWSVKRQTTGPTGWTLAKLAGKDEHGRSILGDLVTHVERARSHIAVFASTLGAARLEEIRAAAATAPMLKQRLAQSGDLKAEYDKHLLPLFGGDAERARRFLLRLQIRTADETSLRTQSESMLALLFYSESGGSIDAPAVRRLLSEYMLDHLHRPIDRAALLAHMSEHGFHRKDWKVDITVRDKVSRLCEEYVRPLREQLIGGVLQTLPGAEKLLAPDGMPAARRVLVSGGAGGGKSSELAHLVERLRASSVPTLPVRLDHIDEGVLTSQRLGEALSLPASPVAVLAGLADGGSGVLVLDQLDAVSLASGRRAEVWSLVGRLLAEANGYPNLKVVVACREFDLEHDHRMRSLKAASSEFVVVPLGPFDSQQLDGILADREVHPALRPLLSVPLHLAMFLSLPITDGAKLETRNELFDAFWLQKQRCTSRRLGRPCDFVGVVDQLATWLSDRQELAAPTNVLDSLREDADALASEHVLVLADGRYRFFHEAFFDYAFARRVARTGGRLIDLLTGSEQHLFRRAQVRQVLTYLRSTDLARYLEELRSVLFDGRVRFHIKRVVFQYLNGITDPNVQEWQVLRDLEVTAPEISGHVRGVILDHPGWFDALDAAGFIAMELASGDPQREERIVLLLATSKISKQRSARVATLLSEHRRTNDTWARYFQYVFRDGDVFHSREMFDLFLSSIRDGTLDETRQGFSPHVDWWHTLYSMAKEAPAMASETIGVWFDRKLTLWREARSREAAAREGEAVGDVGTDSIEKGIGGAPDSDGEHVADTRSDISSLGDLLDADGNAVWILSDASAASSVYVEHVLPHVADVIAEGVRPNRDRLEVDALWSFRHFGDESYSTHAALFNTLARALVALAGSAPAEVDRMLGPYVERPHDAVAYLVLRAWAAAPEVYAERLAVYLAADPRRLKVGYSMWGCGADPAMAENYRSIEAVRVSSSRCSKEAFTALETAIVELKDQWETRHPQSRGIRQLQLLTALDATRLSPRGRAKLAELRAKFPDIGHEPPRAMEVRAVESPIPTEAQAKMTNDQWLSAMTRYAGVGTRDDARSELSGGESELAHELEARTKEDPRRFIALAAKMPDDLPATYYDAILRGVANSTPPVSGLEDSSVALGEAIGLVKRVHSLRDRPCGRWVTYLITKWAGVDWSSTVMDAVKWYAENDPDPTEELWCKEASGGQPYYGGAPHAAGINSTRGSAAGAVAQLLFDSDARADTLLGTIKHLSQDASIAVRSCAIDPLLALLNTRADLAIPWFIECVRIDPILLAGPGVERFIYYAGRRDYTAIRPVVMQMLSSSDAAVVKAASRVCCLVSLGVEEAQEAHEDAQQVRIGVVAMRLAAATIYASNVAHKEVGATSRKLLLPFFSDPEDDVRARAARAFQHIAELDVSRQGELLDAFLNAQPSHAALEPVIRALEDSPVQLPGLVCRLVEAGTAAYEADGGDIRTKGFVIASDLSKIAIRLYTQTGDESIRRRCLDAMDKMERAGFWGLTEELKRIDR